MMDDSDMVFVTDGVTTDGVAEAYEDFEDLKVAIEAKPDDIYISNGNGSNAGGGGGQVAQYLDNFDRLFATPGVEDRLRKLAYSCYLRPGGFRGLCWAFWLKLLSGSNQSEWIADWKKRRDIYTSHKAKHCSDNRCDPNFDPKLNNPLSQDVQSPWNVYFMNAELKKEIERDVVRTCPGNEVFKDESVRAMMINILFIFCKEHLTLSYKQGMHEILGSLLLVWKGDVETCVQMVRHVAVNNSPATTLKELMDTNFIEHDTYFFFERAMDHMWDWYYTPDRPPGPASSRLRQMLKPHPHTPFVSPGDVDDGSHCNAIKRLRNMWTNILQLHDKDLFDHLESLMVLPTTFGINWTKLLFSRQFKAYLSMWDAILASHFLLVDYVVVAMVLSIRPMLLSGDSNQCNSLLVSRYPSNVRVDYVISLALHLQDSFRFPKPRGSPFQVAREESPATGFSPLKPSGDDSDVIVGSFDLLSREECNPKFSPTDIAFRDTMETLEASLNELRHALRNNQPPVADNVMRAFQRHEANVQALGRQMLSRQCDLQPSALRRNPYSVAFDALGWVDCNDSTPPPSGSRATKR